MRPIDLWQKLLESRELDSIDILALSNLERKPLLKVADFSLLRSVAVLSPTSQSTAPIET